MLRKYFLVWLNLLLTAGNRNLHGKPNIVLILADDLGINDLSFRGSDQILTPNIDALAYYGTILDRYYVQSLCTPSRGALMTGRYPIHTGLQHFVIPQDEPWGLPLDETTMAEIFRNAGYSTNLVGKWHLGYYDKRFTPTQRGFDNSLGYLGGYIDYYDYTVKMFTRNYSRGYDMRRNLNVYDESEGVYATDLFTNEAVGIVENHPRSKPLFLMVNHLAPHAGNDDKPFQAPEEEIDKLIHISDLKRRTYAAMISKLDESVGKLIEALHKKRMLDNTIVVFFSDNGAPVEGIHANYGSNYPLRGQKDSPWDGGMRSPGIIWSPLLKVRQNVWSELMHITDWLPTLAHAAGVEIPSNLKLDGINLWDALSKGTKSLRTDVVLNIDTIIGYSAYLSGSWKYVNGTTMNGIYDGWFDRTDDEPDPNTKFYSDVVLKSRVSKCLQDFTKNSPLSADGIKVQRSFSTLTCPPRPNETEQMYNCNPLKEPCLFDIQTDPCEQYNLAWKYPSKVVHMRNMVNYYQETARPSVRAPSDPNCDPVNFNYTWTWWKYDHNALRNLAVKLGTMNFILLYFCVAICFLFYNHL